MGLAKYAEDIQRKRDDLRHFGETITRDDGTIRSEGELRVLSQRLKKHADEFLELYSEITDISKNDRLQLAQQNHALKKTINQLEGKILTREKLGDIEAYIEQQLNVRLAGVVRDTEDKLLAKHKATVTKLRGEIRAKDLEHKKLKEQLKRLHLRKSRHRSAKPIYKPALFDSLEAPPKGKQKKLKPRKLKRPPKKSASVARSIRGFKPQPKD